AVERVVDEQELHHTALCLLDDGGGELGAHHHALGARRDAGGQRLALALHLDQALTAGADRIEQRVVAEPRDRDAEQLRGPDDQGSLRHADLEPVNGDGHCARRGLHCHVMLQTVDDAGSKGQPPSLWCWMNSSRKKRTAVVIGGTALSPSAQNARPRMLSQISRSFSTSSSVPSPCSSRSRMRTSQNVPSRHGVHFPHDSCW